MKIKPDDFEIRVLTGQGTELCLGAVSSNEFRKDSKIDFLHISIFVP